MQTQDNFCHGDGKTQTLAAVEVCSKHTGYNNKEGKYLTAIQLDGKYVKKKFFVFTSYRQLY